MLTCDCGEPAAVRLRCDDQICQRCAELECNGPVEHEVVHALLGGPASLDDLAARTGARDRVVDRALGRLMQRGRVSRTMVESETAGGLYMWRLT